MTVSTTATITSSEDLAGAHRYNDSKRRRPKRRYWERERTPASSPRASNQSETSSDGPRIIS
jgi:hypothetical protein